MTAIRSLSHLFREQTTGFRRMQCGVAAGWSGARWIITSWATCGPRGAGIRGLSALSKPPKAAALIIGDEVKECSSEPCTIQVLADKFLNLCTASQVLSGSVVDSNTPYLAKLLHSRGVDMVKVEVVEDKKAAIVDSIHRLKGEVGSDGFVFTSGGIGPTHDDVTYEAIASAFGLQLAVHQETLAKMEEYYSSKGLEVNESRLRMAKLPETCEALFTPGLWVPLAVVDRNVYVLPGIPRLFCKMIDAHKTRFSGPKFYGVACFTSVGEGILAEPLASIQSKHPDVRIGSYPAGIEGVFSVKLVVEGRDPTQVKAAADAIEKDIKVDRREELQN